MAHCKSWPKPGGCGALKKASADWSKSTLHYWEVEHMALRDWISNPGQVATATPATLATHDHKPGRTVATVASVIVASEKKRGGLTALPPWCRADCPGLETIDLPNEGEVAGCVHPVTGSWRRLVWMTGCAALSFKRSVPTVPEWCRGARCANYCRVDVPGLEIIQRCEIDTAHGRRWAKIDRMNGCPMKKE